MESFERFDHATGPSQRSWFGRIAHRLAHSFIEREHRSRYEYVSQYAWGKRVLDLACGEGYGALLLHQSGAVSILAGDKEPAVIESAQAKYGQTGIEYRVMDAESLQLPAHSVDLVVSFETIEHLEHPEAFLKAIRMIASDRADIFISTPNRRVSNPGTALSDKPKNPYHVREYTPEEFQQLLGQYFEVRQLFGQGIYLKSRHAFVSRFLRLIKALLVVLPGGTYWLARIHPLGFLSEPTYVVAHCINCKQ